MIITTFKAQQNHGQVRSKSVLIEVVIQSLLDMHDVLK